MWTNVGLETTSTGTVAATLVPLLIKVAAIPWQAVVILST